MIDEKTSLPHLRNDLKLLPGPALENGSPSWTLYDPVRNRFYRIGWLEFELLARWNSGDANQVIEGIQKETPLQVTPEDIEQFYYFLSNNCLLDPGNPAVMNRLRQSITRPKESLFKWLLKHYLFIRIPLFHPDPFLDSTLPFVRIFATRSFFYLLVIAIFFSFFLIVRQWEAFTHTFFYFFSLKGMIWYAMAIFISKLIHELGHAYTSKYFGIRVPTMGIAFLVLWPMLYTDNSEAWRLKNRFPRIAIVLAGTIAELVMAVAATLLWSFLPDSPIRSASFILATTTWISSLMMNLNPFMRFDGYYFLSDFLDVPNLQDRAFALGKWYMRKMLFGLDIPIPERFPEKKSRILILYAYSTWIYRLILFTAIALMVYHLFFKMLGIFLFLVEICWFVLLPIYRELQAWWRGRALIGCNGNILITVSLIILFFLVLIIPWKSHVSLPALLKPGASVRIYPPYSACIRQIPIKNGDHVQKGDLLFALHSPRLEFEEKQAAIQVSILEEQLRRGFSHGELIEQTQVIQQQLAQALTRLQGCQNEKKQLNITASANSVIMDMAEGLRPGIWVNKKQILAILVNPALVTIEGYLLEEMIENVKSGNKALFYMENRDTDSVRCTVHKIAPTGSQILKEPYLASIYGGDLPVTPENMGQNSPPFHTPSIRLVSHKSLYRVILTPENIPELSYQIVRGRVRIQGKPQSLLYRAWIRVAAVFIRESGF